MTCSKGPQVRLKLWASAARTRPLYMTLTVRHSFNVAYFPVVDMVEMLPAGESPNESCAVTPEFMRKC